MVIVSDLDGRSTSPWRRELYGEPMKGCFCNGEYCVFGDVETGARTSKPSFVNPAKRTNSSVPSKMNPFNKSKKHIKTCDQAIQNV